MRVITIRNASQAPRTIGTEKYKPSINLKPGEARAVDAEMWARLKEGNPALAAYVADGIIVELGFAESALGTRVDAANAKATDAATEAAKAAGLGA